MNQRKQKGGAGKGMNDRMFDICSFLDIMCPKHYSYCAIHNDVFDDYAVVQLVNYYDTQGHEMPLK